MVLLDCYPFIQLLINYVVVPHEYTQITVLHA